MLSEPKLFFISVNTSWGGSEELWFRAALNLQTRCEKIYTATQYSHANLKKLKINFYYSFHYRINKTKRLLIKLKLQKKAVNPLYSYIKQLQPTLIIISQGDNVSSLELMHYCCTNGFKFITITQLVAEAHFYAFNEMNLEQYQTVYSKALINFFVSENNLRLNNLMLGIELSNAVTILNPCKVFGEKSIEFLDSQQSNIALLGRIECFQKGYDILLQVLNSKKWKARNIHFNIYGEGPHFLILKKNIERLQLTNISLKGFCEDIRTVWQENHLLCMPSRLEGQALTLIEAMYFGRTAVVTDVGGATELITDEVNGFVANTASIESIDDALERAWKRRAEWENMGALCRELVLEKYKVPAEVALNNQIESLLGTATNCA